MTAPGKNQQADSQTIDQSIRRGRNPVAKTNAIPVEVLVNPADQIALDQSAFKNLSFREASDRLPDHIQSSPALNLAI